MGDVITSREEFFAVRKPKMFAVELPDMGRTVNVLKGTVKTLEVMDTFIGENDGALQQVALILVDPDGNRLLNTPEDIEKARGEMSLDDLRAILDEFAMLNHLTKPKIQETIKNSEASLSVVSASA